MTCPPAQMVHICMDATGIQGERSSKSEVTPHVSGDWASIFTDEVSTVTTKTSTSIGSDKDVYLRLIPFGES